MQNYKYNYIKRESDKNKHKFDVDIDNEQFNINLEHEISKLNKNFRLKGFRKGHVPINIAKPYLIDNAYKALINKMIPSIVSEIIRNEEKNNEDTQFLNSVDYIFDDKNILKFSFFAYCLPEIDFDVMKNNNLRLDIKDVTDKEIEDVIINLIKDIRPELLQDQTENISLTDDLIAQIGYEDIKNLQSLKSRVNELLTINNIRRAKSDLFEKMIDIIINKFEFYVPNTMVEEGIDLKEQELKQKLKQFKIELESFLKTQGKNFDELKNEWYNQQTNLLKREIVILKISKDFDIKPTQEEINEVIKNTNYDSIDYEYLQKISYSITQQKCFDKLIELSGVKIEDSQTKSVLDK